MLKEFTANKNIQDGKLKKRWFYSDEVDLFMWTDQEGEFVDFQLSYDKSRVEKVLRWSVKSGFTHCVIDSGDLSPESNMSPLFLPMCECPDESIIKMFDEVSKNIDKTVFNFVKQKMEGLKK